MIDVFPIKLEGGEAYVLTAEVIGVFPSKRFDRCMLYVNGYPDPLEVYHPAQDVAALWHSYLIADFEDCTGDASDE